MKTSTDNHFYNVKGVIFLNEKYKPLIVTVSNWVKEGMPENCFVYDGLHQLLSAGIPVVDAVEVEGRWIKTPLPAKCPVTKYRKQVATVKKTIRVSRIALETVPFITAVGAKKRKIR